MIGSTARRGQVLSTILFGSRWLQLPLYLGLIIAQCVYVVHFMVELQHLVVGTMTLNEEKIMLIVLGLIDVVMISSWLKNTTSTPNWVASWTISSRARP